jgi:hypothetical protein
MIDGPTQALRQAVHQRSGGRCECPMVMICDHHDGRCPEPLSGDWQVHRLKADGTYTPDNVIGLCGKCHRNTPSYGVDRH